MLWEVRNILKTGIQAKSGLLILAEYKDFVNEAYNF